MHSNLARYFALFLLAIAVFPFEKAVGQQHLTVQVGTPPAPPLIVVNSSDTWRYRRGTNEPQTDWRTAANADLDSTWLSGPGGFGYGDAGIQGEATTISGMRNVHSTLYVRREFELPADIDSSAELRLRVDYDDGFVAYLDGVELVRANVPGVSNSPVAFTAFASTAREASCCQSPNPAVTFNLGPVGARLSAGAHVLSFVALNDDLNSSDLHLIPSLLVAESQSSSGVVNRGLYTLSSSNTLVLTGSNTVAGATRVTVNGDDASFSAASGTWNKTQTLAPGLNRLFIAALDPAGNLRSNIVQDVVYEGAPVTVGGQLIEDTAWTNVNEVIHVTSTVTVSNGTTLTIGPGVVVIVSPGASLLAGAGGTIDVQGSDGREVFFLPSGTAVWGEIAAAGAGSSLTLRYADVNRGAVKFRNGAVGLMEDCYLHEYKSGGTPIAGCTSAQSVTVRRCRFNIYHETLWQNTLTIIEDSLFENADNDSSDALDFDGVPPGSVIRRCTFRYGPRPNTDAIDIGPFGGGVGSTNTIIEDCIMRDFPNDKGVSIGEGCYGIVVRNCLIYRTESGIGIKDSPGGRPPCTAIVYNCTIADSEFGFRCYNKSNPSSPSEGGQITNSFNNILWGNDTTIGVFNGGFVVAEFSDFEGTNWPGAGNIDADPLFVNRAAGDYRLQPGSPAIGTGMGGTNMGVQFPIGGIPSAPFHLAALSAGTNFVTLNWREDADNEDGYVIERSTDALTWVQVGEAAPNETNFVDAASELDQKYYYRVRTTNFVGASPFSNVTSGKRQPPVLYIGGAISTDTLWAAGVTIVVTSSVTVASGVTLTIEPGVNVLLNQGANLVMNGLLIAEGEENNRIVFTRATGATSWGTLDLFGSANTHRLRYVDLAWSTGNIDATGTAVYLDNIWWTNTTAQLVDAVSSSLALLNSYIPGGSGNEPVHFSTMPANGYALIKGNIFGAPQGYNDSIDLTGGNRPGPIVQFIDNIFLGAVDDCVDLDATDAHIEGNIFMNVRQDASRASTANALATGEGSGSSEIVVVRNIFYNCDHAMLLKDFGSAVFENNTVVTIYTNQFSRTPASYIQFGEPHRGVPGGRGILMNGNIFWDLRSTTPFTFFTNGPMFMVANQNIIQGTNIASGGNSTNDPAFVNWESGITHLNIRSNLSLLPGSPALGTGPNGLDMGALVPAGASISGEPVGTTTTNSATLRVAGPGIYAYRWKLNNGPWSAEVPLTNNILITATLFADAAPIELTDLTNGTYTVSVIGKNSAGTWQDTNAATVSRTWTVDNNGDSDGDGMPDVWEDAHGFDRNLASDATEDADDDGMSNRDEYLAGTDPRNAASRLALVVVSVNSLDITLRFTAMANKTYSVQYRDSLSAGDWQSIADVPADSADRDFTFMDFLPPGATTRFYRVVTPSMP